MFVVSANKGRGRCTRHKAGRQVWAKWLAQVQVLALGEASVGLGRGRIYKERLRTKKKHMTFYRYENKDLELETDVQW